MRDEALQKLAKNEQVLHFLAAQLARLAKEYYRLVDQC
jgi:hypothetical protein